MKKKFDCVKMKKTIQADIYQATKDFTDEQLSAYYRKSVETGPLSDWWKRVNAAQAKRKRTG